MRQIRKELGIMSGWGVFFTTRAQGHEELLDELGFIFFYHKGTRARGVVG